MDLTFEEGFVLIYTRKYYTLLIQNICNIKYKVLPSFDSITV